MSLLKLSNEKYPEVRRMTDYNRVSYFTAFHQNREVYLAPQYNMNGAFTEKLMAQNMFMMGAKILLITGGSAGFGFAMGFIMSGFEF